ncbi:MAG: aminotransferase class III-fold pyridoxal phosphate-dependent enzyme, partial [Acidimicrobiales bacterium]
VRFTSSGTEACLLALHLARAATGREKIVKLGGHFHGWHDELAVGADPPFDRPGSAGLVAATKASVVDPADEQALAGALAGGDVAAVILEPSGAAWGTVPIDEVLLGAARRLASDSGALLIFDEVVTGFRWSPGGVQAVMGITPDLTVLGKILAGGLPGGAVCGGSEIMEHIGVDVDAHRRVAHPGTHNAHPLSAAAGATTLGLLRSGERQQEAAAKAAVLRTELSSVFAELGVPGCAYGESSTFHLLFGTDRPPGELDPAALKAPLGKALSSALHCGMLLGGVHLFHGSGFLSTEHTDRDLDRTIGAFRATLPLLWSEALL